jgi:hypothetical protein
MPDLEIAYDRRELVGIAKAFRAMEDEAKDEARSSSNALASFSADKIKQAAYLRTKNSTAVKRIADGVRVSKSSTIGEFSYGFATQKFSGGGTTRQLWPGFEFGSNKFKQFPTYSGRFGRGSRGWFIYPTLRRIQPDIVKQWEEAASNIMKKWDD